MPPRPLRREEDLRSADQIWRADRPPATFLRRESRCRLFLPRRDFSANSMRRDMAAPAASLSSRIDRGGRDKIGPADNARRAQARRLPHRLRGGGGHRPYGRLKRWKSENATPYDAIAGCVVLKRSIAELCIRDHKNDPAILARWLGNKTTESFAAWAEQRDNSLLVAVEDGHILAVGSVTDAGTIGLNYLSPDARFRGVSRALL